MPKQNLESPLVDPRFVIGKDPLFSADQKEIAYRLRVYSSGTHEIQEFAEEFYSIASELEKVNKQFLFRFVDEDSLSIYERCDRNRLPPNIHIYHPDHCLGAHEYAFNQTQYVGGWREFFARFVKPRPTLSPTEATLIRTIACLRRNADLPEVVDAIKADPAVQYNLVRHLNMAHVAFEHKFRNFEQAVMVLGYRNLERWLSTYLIWSSVSYGMPELFRVALARAKQMEFLAGQQGLSETMAGIAYISGVFSVIPKILGVPLETAIAPLPRDDVLTQTLLGKNSPLATSMKLVNATEEGSQEDLFKHLRLMKIHASDANMAMVRGITFAETEAML